MKLSANMQPSHLANIIQLSQEVGELLHAQSQILATAESCTGGGVAAAITEIAGSSAWFDRAFVTYSNEAKMEMIAVSLITLEHYGAVSEMVVKEMAKGALTHSHATISVAISGVAGPSGGSESKPVGTVCFAWADIQGWSRITTQHFSGDRAMIRSQAILFALTGLKEHLMQ